MGAERSDFRRRFWAWLPWQLKLALDLLFLVAGAVAGVCGLLIIFGIMDPPSYRWVAGVALLAIGGWFLDPIDWWTDEELGEETMK